MHADVSGGQGWIRTNRLPSVEHPVRLPLRYLPRIPALATGDKVACPGRWDECSARTQATARESGAGGWVRTTDLQARGLALYPATPNPKFDAVLSYSRRVVARGGTNPPTFQDRVLDALPVSYRAKSFEDSDKLSLKFRPRS